ncbi:MAG: Acyl carrier protein phosphodiesterase [Bacteroidia bacterium]|nr:Acyl carrier protein phosphodiesterase [Bacteroidia bacterium]
MNFLAHLYLSHTSEELMFGNYIADGVRGKLEGRFSDKVIEGIRMHRAIDDFTDAHPVFKQSCMRLYEKYDKYAWVIVDIFYDHFLAANWNEFHHQPLQTFSAETYLMLEKKIELMPEKSKRFFHYMTEYNILFNYSKTDGIQRVLTGMARRARFQSNMEKATADLITDYHYYEKDFRLFFPELEKFTKENFSL